VAERDVLIRTSPYYWNRQYYKCGCFKSEETCEDFGEGRGNRMGSEEAECEWVNERCREV
jgi:hypothetical protein